MPVPPIDNRPMLTLWGYFADGLSTITSSETVIFGWVLSTTRHNVMKVGCNQFATPGGSGVGGGGGGALTGGKIIQALLGFFLK